MGAEQPRLGGPIVILGHQNAALPRGDRFDRMKRKGSDVGPRMAAQLPLLAIGTKASADTVAGILNHKRTMRPRNLTHNRKPKP